MRRNIKLISAVITVILFFILNAIMSSIDFGNPQNTRILAIVSVSLVGAVLVIFLILRFRGQREKIV